MKKIALQIFGLFLIVTMLTGFQATAQTSEIDATGSNTVFPIINAAAAEWSQDSGVTVSASGPGSGAGITALINGQTDLAPMSRAPKDSEISSAEDAGMDLNITIVALDALVVIVNKENPITDMSAAVIQGIFDGTIRTWSELGWEDAVDDNIKVVERDENSGTHDFFNDFFLEGEEVPADELGTYHSQFTSTSNLFETVATEENAIGYGGFGFLDDTVSAIGVNGVDASKEGASSGNYPVSRPLFVVFDSNGVVAEAVDFVEFLLSDRGQEIADEEGYVSCGEDCGFYDKAGLSDFLDAIDQRITDAFDYSGDSVVLDPNYTPADGLPFNFTSFVFGLGVFAIGVALIRRRKF